MNYYDFYSLFKENEKILQIPFISLPIKNTDKTYTWNKSADRLDTVSQKYYGHPYGGKLILMTNPVFGGSEDDIPDGATIIVPFPYKESVQNYINITNNFKSLY